MGSAIAKALLKDAHYEVAVSNPEAPRFFLSSEEKKRFSYTKENSVAVEDASVIIIAVKPKIVEEVLNELAPQLQKDQIIISIAAGVTLASLKSWSKSHKKLVRVMPNLPAQIFAGVSVWKQSGLTASEKELVAALLAQFGFQIEVSTEDKIDMATAVSGGGPAYVAAFIESCEHALQSAGYSKLDARHIALATVAGSAHYINNSEQETAAVKEAVQTKGGTTEAGFKVLKKNKWQSTLEKAFAAGYKKAQELGGK